MKAPPLVDPGPEAEAERAARRTEDREWKAWAMSLVVNADGSPPPALEGLEGGWRERVVARLADRRRSS